MPDLNSIIEDNIGLIKAQLKKLNLAYDPEAESIGYEALYNAVISFDADKGYRLSTYATCCIYNALGSYIRSINKKRQLEIVSYHNIAYVDDNTVHDFLDVLSDNTSVEQDYLQAELCAKVRTAYDEAYNCLTNEKHKAIVLLWHESDYTITNKEVARQVGVSQPYVNQVINTFKASLRKRLEDYYYA